MQGALAVARAVALLQFWPKGQLMHRDAGSGMTPAAVQVACTAAGWMSHARHGASDLLTVSSNKLKIENVNKVLIKWLYRYWFLFLFL